MILYKKALFMNIRLGSECLARTNTTRAYLAVALITIDKVFIAQSQFVHQKM
jgi:hypothetical protein